MRYSKMLIPTMKESPAEADIASHRLMLRAGLIRKLASGTYTYLPLGFRCLCKVMEIVRQELNSTGAQEILMPSVQPVELWQRSGREVDYGPTMAKFEDRHGRVNVLAPTAEEVVTNLAAGEINSYRQLPFNIYQISFKFRDEFRPRFGVLRSREFIMKDAYSFHADDESLGESYEDMYRCYCRIFRRCGLDYVVVEAESGQMGGSDSQQFTVPCENGEDIIVQSADGSYAANIEKAAVDASPRQKVNSDVPPAEEVHTPGVGSIEEVCGFLKSRPENMIKTLIYLADGKPIAIVLRGEHELNPEKLSSSLAGKSVELAEQVTIEKVTGASVGFAGPCGLENEVEKLVIDHSVAAMGVGITGANKTDYHLKNVVPGRDFPLEGERVTVADIRNAVEGDTYKGRKLIFKKGIEVGQLFKLGRKYTEKLGAKFLDESGQEKLCTMGCYGIGINRIIAAAIERGNDSKGIIWPISIAPFEVLITIVNEDDKAVVETGEDIYRRLRENGLDVLLDERSLRAGVKFKDAELIGIPLRVTVGKRSLSEGKVEVKWRGRAERMNVPEAQAVKKVIELVSSAKRELETEKPAG